MTAAHDCCSLQSSADQGFWKARSWKIANGARPRRGMSWPNDARKRGSCHSTTPLIGLVGGPVPSRIQHTEPLTLISGCDRRKETSPANAPGPGLTHSACPVWCLPGLTAWGGFEPGREFFDGQPGPALVAAPVNLSICQSVNRHCFSLALGSANDNSNMRGSQPQTNHPHHPTHGSRSSDASDGPCLLASLPLVIWQWVATGST
jgi:hypothetical protein